LKHLEKFLGLATVSASELQLPESVFHTGKVLIQVFQEDYARVKVQGAPHQEGVHKIHVTVPVKEYCIFTKYLKLN